MKLLSLLSCFLLVSVHLNQTNGLPQFITADLAFKAANAIYSALPIVKKYLKDGDKTPEEELLTGQRNILNKLNQLSDDVASAKERILSKITRTLRSKLSQKTDEIFRHIEEINISYNNLQNMNGRKRYSRRELLEFARVNTGFSLHELPAVIEKMHSALVNKDFNGDSVLSIMGKSAHEFNTACIRSQSAQQLIYDIYKIVVDNDIKGLLVKLFSYDILKKYEKDEDVDYNETIEREKDKHYERLNATYNVVKNYMRNAPRKFWVCGPIEDNLGVTYAKLNVFQGFFMYETDTTLNREGLNFDLYRTVANSLITSCSDLVDERYRCFSAVCKAQPENRRCSRLRDCSFIDNNIQVCHSPSGSDRRYDWMRLIDSGDTYGDYYDTCENTQGMEGMTGFSICFCNCENEVQKSPRYFSLKDVKADVDKNKVVTGVRLRKIGNVIYLQIQQGEIDSNGQINGEVEWKPIDEISEKDLLSQKVSKYNYFKYDLPSTVHRYEEWTEFYKNNLVYTVTYKQNTVYLDDIEADNSYLVTGVRFQQENDALRLEVEITPYLYRTGYLLYDQKRWKYNRKTTHERREVTAKINDIPTKSVNLDTYSGKDHFVRFKLSDLNKDVSQNTIPFIDLQPVIPKADSPLPLSGVGIFYKHDEQHAGYIGLKGIHYDLTANL